MKMSLVYYILESLLFLSQLHLHSAKEFLAQMDCVFSCGSLGELYPPFSNSTNSTCAMFVIDCTEDEPKVQFRKQGKWYPVNYINLSSKRIQIHDQELEGHLASNQCDFLKNFTDQAYLLKNFTKQQPPFFSINFTETHSFLKCKRGSGPPLKFGQFQKYTSCEDNYDLYYYDDDERHLLPTTDLPNYCTVVNLPSAYSDTKWGKENLTSFWSANFNIHWETLPDCDICSRNGGRCSNNANNGFECKEADRDVIQECKACLRSGGQCLYKANNNFECKREVLQKCTNCSRNGGTCLNTTNNISECQTPKGRSTTMKIGIGLGAAFGTLILACIAFIIYHRYQRKKSDSSSNLISRSLSRDDSLKPDPENGSIYFKTPIFTYKELDEATDHFDEKKELGDGGFGTVYHGKLRDGRVVAVKRLFENNYKRVEQFMNEIEILSLLRHQNLVSLYGCTSRHSRELLLVYEYVPNGTIADHIHGDLAKENLLTWPIRMNIAIESADALAYLHASEIIHRDVKSNNILLDNNFHVKVADFGLSRLFPTDVTHVSTAPQGTPGYVDPEYYQCYQLNDKSDVYSFGVVLIELISSKPAVDISRHRHEINLANMAINRIQQRALHELVDPNLGYETDYEVRNMMTLVAELAFRCLQQEKDMRPCMMEVLEILQGIASDTKNKTDDMDTSAASRLLKHSQPLSPDAVTDKWPSRTTTPNTSG